MLWLMGVCHFHDWVDYERVETFNIVREVVKTNILKRNSPNHNIPLQTHKMVSLLHSHPPSSSEKNIGTQSLHDLC